jgi:hypothetical protein
MHVVMSQWQAPAVLGSCAKRLLPAARVKTAAYQGASKGAGSVAAAHHRAAVGLETSTVYRRPLLVISWFPLHTQVRSSFLVLTMANSNAINCLEEVETGCYAVR